MNTAKIIHEAEADGVHLALSATGTLKAIGDGERVAYWLPTIREHKAAIVALLSAYPDAGESEPAANDHEPAITYSLPTSPDTDDRITCAMCSHYAYSGICTVARPGGIVSAQVGYRPAGPTMLQRCNGYEAKLERSEND
jgi:hypothetical protein